MVIQVNVNPRVELSAGDNLEPMGKKKSNSKIMVTNPLNYSPTNMTVRTSIFFLGKMAILILNFIDTLTDRYKE